MQSALFGLKRAHHSALRFCRLMLTDKNLTPAQYDMFQALKRWREFGMRQRGLHRVLGVTRQTVSEMLGSLERRGLVRREIDPTDRRCKIVWLTDEGFARLEAAYDPIVKHGWVRAAVDMTLATGGNVDVAVSSDGAEEMRELEGHLWSFRRAFCDTGSLTYGS
jgi:DNA-binding MarR family transcriptional regulator